MSGARPVVVYSGRSDLTQHGAYESALMVRGIGPERPVRMVVNGAPPETVRAARRLLSQVAGRAVEVRAYSADKQAQRELVRAADLVIVPAHAENVGMTALDAIMADVPVLVPDTCGVGNFLVKSGRIDPRVAEHSVIRRAEGEAVAPIDRWVAELAAVVDDPRAARRRAAELRGAVVAALRTLQSAGQSAGDLIKSIMTVREEKR
ncbi:glycosyltransferase [Actinokineospora auranticolor]|uniref:Glycosyl transferase family 1 n=1 Tax=Actinokineospora auranticolor TaxID=155976 RepID=A0A2S6GYW1_9PSEU|nr:glycosyltransferase [Actinokineospora auranticolor]PPK70413.1 glycosyl transferase family 1 [Actinokineospora auranticolor]